MHVSLTVSFTVFFYTIFLCSKSTVGLRFDFIPEDVRNVVDDNIITPAKNTLLGVLARKSGLIDFFVNFIRGTRHTFLGGYRKERRKPRNGFPKYTTKTYGPILYQDTTTTQRIMTQQQLNVKPTSNFHGIYTMIAPDLRTTSESWLESGEVEALKSIRGRDVNFYYDSKEASTKEREKLEGAMLEKFVANPTAIRPFFKSVMSATNQKNNLNANHIKYNNQASDTTPEFEDFPFMSTEMQKVASLPTMFKNIQRFQSPFRMYQMTNYTIQSQPKDSRNFRAQKQRNNSPTFPFHSVSLSSSEQLLSAPNLLTASTVKQLDYQGHMLQTSASGQNENIISEKVSTLRKKLKDFNKHKFQVLARTDQDNQHKNSKVGDTKVQPASVISPSKRIESLNDKIQNENVTITPRSKILAQKLKDATSKPNMKTIQKLVDNEFLAESIVNQNVIKGNISKNFTEEKNKVTQDPLLNTSESMLDITRVTSSPINHVSNLNDNIIHRFQFFYSPKRKAYGFSAINVKENNRKSSQKFKKDRRAKRKRKRNIKKKKNAEVTSNESKSTRYQNYVNHDEHNPELFHQVSVFSTETPFPILHVNYKFHDMSNVKNVKDNPDLQF